MTAWMHLTDMTDRRACFREYDRTRRQRDAPEAARGLREHAVTLPHSDGFAVVTGTRFVRRDCPTCGPETLALGERCAVCGHVYPPPRKSEARIDVFMRRAARSRRRGGRRGGKR